MRGHANELCRAVHSSVAVGFCRDQTQCGPKQTPKPFTVQQHPSSSCQISDTNNTRQAPNPLRSNNDDEQPPKPVHHNDVRVGRNVGLCCGPTGTGGGGSGEPFGAQESRQACELIRAQLTGVPLRPNAFGRLLRARQKCWDAVVSDVTLGLGKCCGTDE
jgi:hypothetical protein